MRLNSTVASRRCRSLVGHTGHWCTTFWNKCMCVCADWPECRASVQEWTEWDRWRVAAEYAGVHPRKTDYETCQWSSRAASIPDPSITSNTLTLSSMASWKRSRSQYCSPPSILGGEKSSENFLLAWIFSPIGVKTRTSLFCENLLNRIKILSIKDLLCLKLH